MNIFDLPKVNLSFFLVALIETASRPKSVSAAVKGTQEEINRGAAFLLACVAVYFMVAYSSLGISLSTQKLFLISVSTSIMQMVVTAAIYAGVFFAFGYRIGAARIITVQMFLFGTFFVIGGMTQLFLLGTAKYIGGEDLETVRAGFSGCYVDSMLAGEQALIQSQELLLLMRLATAMLLMFWFYLEVSMLLGFRNASDVSSWKYAVSATTGFVVSSTMALALIGPISYAAWDFNEVCATLSEGRSSGD